MSGESLKIDGGRLTMYFEAPQWEGRPTAALGGFSCQTQESGAALLETALDKIRARGITRVIGPMDGDTWHSYRFVSESDGSAPFLLEPTNKPHERQVFLAAGFAPVSGYFSARVPLAQAVQNAPGPQADLRIETWNGKDPEGLFTQVYELSSAAFAGNAFYKPIDRATFLAMYMPIVAMLKPGLIFFARRPDNSLAGFLFGIPDYAEGATPKTVILKTYASLDKGAGRLLAHAFHTGALAAGYTTAIHALIHDDNLSALRSAAEGSQVFRRYSLLGRRLDG